LRVGNYGYDWTLSIPIQKTAGTACRGPQYRVLSVSDSWQRASDADADLDLDYDTLNPHFEYIDEDNNQRHVVWFLDAVSLLDEMRGARELGLQTFALWRLGAEDSSLWNIGTGLPIRIRCRRWPAAARHDVDTRRGRYSARHRPAAAGKRTVEVDTDEPDPRKKLIIDEHMDVYPRTYTIEQYGYHPKELALSFDDGPDPKWTPKILDILKQKNAKGTFFLIAPRALTTSA